MKTYSQKPATVNRKWYVIDAKTAPLGRVATVAASLLLGKGKPTVTSHVDGGDFVIITNAAELVVTGNKAEKKVYYRHSGFPGGLYQRSLKEQQAQDPTSLISKAIRGMLPVNKLRDQRLARLKIYEGADHNHAAQKPEEVKLRGRNNGK
jgi:large subunit ribosomal protein L13